MNDRMTIAAMAMQGMLANSSIDILEPAEYAGDAVRYADALLKALAESEAESPGHHDEVGDWGEYVRDTDAVKHVSCGDMEQALAAFAWISTPQGYDFWEAVYSGDVSALTITRARDFARRVLEAMEASDE